MIATKQCLTFKYFHITAIEKPKDNILGIHNISSFQKWINVVWLLFSQYLYYVFRTIPLTFLPQILRVGYPKHFNEIYKAQPNYD